MNHNLNFLNGVEGLGFRRSIQGTTIGVMMRDTRSLDYGSYLEEQPGYLA